MTSFKLMICASAALAALAACGTATSSEGAHQSLKDATAAAVTGVEPDAVTVIASERSPAKWTWTASVNGQVYQCDADNLMRLPSCISKS